MTFAELKQRWTWKPIRNCPGRYVLASRDFSGPPEQLLAGPAEIRRFEVPSARDVVLVAALDSGGIICYERQDGSYLHTLNTAEGFERKLAQLGIEW